MFERFTDRARSVLVLAQDEARQFNHSFIGTEHILLGLIREGDGVAGKVLTSFGISLGAVRQQVQETIGAEPTDRDRASGSPPFTPRAKKVLELSLREALQLGHSYIGTEHILLGIIREGEGVGTTILMSLGVDLSAARQRVKEFMSGYATPLPGVDAVPAGYFRSHSKTTTWTGSEPRCPECRAELAECARFRTIEVPSDSQDDERGPLPTYVVYCMDCGTALHMFTRDP
jgi:ATP-dependent Clp protease ATP-binding subunit ClpA